MVGCQWVRPTLKGGGKVGARVSELDVFVSPPGNSSVAQRDADFGAVWVVVK